MSAYSDLDLHRRAQRGADKIKSSVATLAEDARDHLSSARERGLDLANASSERAVRIARQAGDHARRRPVSTGLIAGAVGIGLVFLLSSRARSAAMSGGSAIWDALNKRR